VLVALSGGADSVALLHLLRFAAGGAGPELRAAHFDHAMRAGSDADARWVRGLCHAWGVPLAMGRAPVAPRGEAEARGVRWAFLRGAAEEAGAAWIATAHHADDQAETVLFRALRGTGVAGLGGMRDAGEGICRPLLPFWRAELRAHARAHGLRWREDPGNRSLAAARNRVRHALLPLAERAVAPGARRALVRLAALAREDEAAWDAVLAPLEAVATRAEEGAIVLVRSALAGYDSAVALRLLRRVLKRAGVVPGRAGTRSALAFITGHPSGREWVLPGAVRIRTEFDEARIERVAAAEPPPDRPLAVSGASGAGRATIGGREVEVAWRTAPWTGDDDGAAIRTGSAPAPLTLRGWLPGDRMRTRGGTRRLKKLFGEARVPAGRRHTTPVLADAEGRVVWAAGVAQDPATAPRAGEHALLLRIG
jgi:tRNA(Ile)-lysidine synthase